MSVRPTSEIIDDILNRPFTLPAWEGHSQIVSVVETLRNQTRDELAPLIKLDRAIQKIVPQFILQKLAGAEAASGETADISEDELAGKKQEFDAKLAGSLDDESVLKDAIRENSGLSAGHLDIINNGNILQLREFYDALTLNSIFSEHSLAFIYKRLANSSRLLPNMIIAMLAQMALTPYLCARIMDYMQPKESAKMAKYFRPNFLAEVVLSAKPEQVAPITPLLPDSTVRKVIDIMENQQHFMRLATVNDLLEERVSLKLAPWLRDPNSVAKIVSYMENESRITALGTAFNGNFKAMVEKTLFELNETKFALFRGST